MAQVICTFILLYSFIGYYTKTRFVGSYYVIGRVLLVVTICRANRGRGIRDFEYISTILFRCRHCTSILVAIVKI